MRILAAGVAAILLGAGIQAQAPRTGTIEGLVRLTGGASGNTLIRMGADPMCAAFHRARGARPIQQIVTRSTDGGLADVFVNLQGTFPATPVPTTPVVLDQQGCIFSPRVIGARAGQVLQVKNSDATGHNVHGITAKDNTFNVSQPVTGMISKVPLKSEETMLRVRCDIHNWMIAYVGVMSHPYFAVSDTAGAFKIANVPPGKYTLHTWHEKFGEQTQTIEVKAGQTASVDMRYSSSS